MYWLLCSYNFDVVTRGGMDYLYILYHLESFACSFWWRADLVCNVGHWTCRNTDFCDAVKGKLLLSPVKYRRTQKINHWSILFTWVRKIWVLNSKSNYNSVFFCVCELRYLDTQLLYKEVNPNRLYVLLSEVFIVLIKPWGRGPNKYFVNDIIRERGTLTLFWLINDGAVHHHAGVFHISFKLVNNSLWHKYTS